MPENEFDKQVKKMMEELKLRPSEGVWPVVEKRIREKKRRRRAFIFFPLLAGIMLLGYLGFHYFLSKPDNKNFDVRNESFKNDTKTGVKVSTPDIPVADKKNNPSIKYSSPSPENPITKQTKSRKEQISKNSTSKNVRLPKQVIVANKKPHNNLWEPVVQEKQERQAVSASDKKNDKPGYPVETSTDKNDINIKQEKDINPIDEHAKNVFDSNSIKEKIGSNVGAELIFDKPAKDSAVSKPQQQTKILTWGFHIATGISGSRSKLFKFNQVNSLDYNSPNAGTGGPFPAASTVPRTSNAGVAFQAGVLAEKRFSKSSSVDLGLQYSYYSEHLKVGHRSDSIIRIAASYTADLYVSGFYRNTSTNNYVNRYHFIEFPLNYHFQLTHGKQTSLSWDLGFSIGQLISTNTLVFDTANRGVYYTDKNLFRKTHVNLTTGFSMTFNKHRSMEWIIGPKLQVGLSNLYKNYNYKGYLYFAGVDLRLMLPKK